MDGEGRPRRRAGLLLFVVLTLVLVLVVVFTRSGADDCTGGACPSEPAAASVFTLPPTAEDDADRAAPPTTTAAPRTEAPQVVPAEPVVPAVPVVPGVERTSPYEGVGTWLSRYRITREFAGPTPPVGPADVDAMADAGVETIYLQPAADDPRFPRLLSEDLLGEFLVRAHARGVQVVAWYLPRWHDVDRDLRRLKEMVEFRASGEAFDAVAVDIEFTEGTDVPARNAALVELSTRLRALAPDTVLGAVVLPPVVTDVINPAYWPDFPWQEIRDSYDVWMPMAYWSNRQEPEWADAYRYTTENIGRLRAHLGDACAVVSTVGGYDLEETAADYAGMVQAAAEQGAVGVSIWDWPTTPASVWPAVSGYRGQGC